MLPSEQFPWDEAKEVFVLSGFHSLHSLQVVWQWLHRFAGPERPLGAHLLHSLNILWDDIICHADPTPFSISKKHLTNRTAITEAGQSRQCRDWTVLDNFAKENFACFKDLGFARHHKTPILEEWDFCSDGSPYNQIAANYFAKMGHTEGYRA